MTDRPFERFVAKADPATPILDGASTLVDFWRWAFSDLVSNEVRGVFAEFMVGHALGAIDDVRASWDAWDLTYGDTKIEVKATGDVQAWAPTGRPPSPSWSIGRRRGWNAKTNTYASEPLRSAHLYVLCHWRGDDPSPLTPATLDPWDFYVIATKVLDDQFADRKKLSMPQLKRLLEAGDATAANFSTLKAAVDSAVFEGSATWR